MLHGAVLNVCSSCIWFACAQCCPACLRELRVGHTRLVCLCVCIWTPFPSCLRRSCSMACRACGGRGSGALFVASFPPISASSCTDRETQFLNEHSKHAWSDGRACVRARHQRKPHDSILTRNSSVCVSTTSFTVFGATLCDNIVSNEV
jgi:hypothetical protein